MGNRLKNNLGFSLVELLVVMAIAGVLSGIAFPMLFKQLPTWQANGVTSAVSGKLMQARLKAIQTNKKYAVEFSLSGNDSFKIMKCTSDDSPCSTWADAGDAGYAGSVDITYGACSDRVVFNPNGTAGGCNPVWINETGAANVRRKLNLTTSTGRIEALYCEKDGC